MNTHDRSAVSIKVSAAASLVENSADRASDNTSPKDYGAEENSTSDLPHDRRLPDPNHRLAKQPTDYNKDDDLRNNASDRPAGQRLRQAIEASYAVG
jgi:hypothetical protein